jgi:cellulose synthase/poly-beta-1,6-N-acetylglucosamine synthase-like glycosyltransferase
MNVDVIVLTYHDDKEVFNKTIASIYKAIEIAKDYFRLGDFIIVGEEEKGRGRARDVGWRKGKSDYVLFVDTGVVLSNNWLLEIHKAIISVGGDVWFGDSSKAGNPEHLIAKCSEIEYREYANHLRKNGKHVIVSRLNSSNCLFRREILEKVNGFDVNLPFSEDIEIGHRIWKNKGKIIYVYDAKCSNTHRNNLKDRLKQSWKYGVGNSYIRCKHKDFPMRWSMFILLPYSCVKRVIIWGLKYGWIGSYASIIYFFRRITFLIGYFYSQISGIKSLKSFSNSCYINF